MWEYCQLEGAISARDVSEFVFNLRLAKQIEEKLKAEGFAETRLLLTEGKARRSLVKRVDAANNLGADLFLSIHHDSVPNKFLEDRQFEGKKSHFSDRFRGYSVFVSRSNPDFRTSFAFAELIGKEMTAQGLDYARQYSQAIMGRYQRPLLNKETGVYRYDELIVLRKTRMAAALLEAGSIINRDEELKMNSPERRDIISSGVTAAVKEFCEPRWGILGPLYRGVAARLSSASRPPPSTLLAALISSNLESARSNLSLKSHIASRISRKVADVLALSACPKVKMLLFRRYAMILGSEIL